MTGNKYGILGLLLVALGCANQSVSNQVVSPSRFYTHSATDSRVIVFIHGIQGNDEGTWTNKDTASYWPDLVLKDSALDGTSIYLFNYYSPLMEHAASVPQLAERLSADLKSQGIFDFPEVHIIAHSMGGVITQQMLANLSRERDTTAFTSISSVSLLGVPSQGSDLAKLARLLGSRNPQYRNLESIEYNGLLQSIDNVWNIMFQEREAARRKYPAVFCIYENIETKPVGLIVSGASAKTRCDNKSYLDYTHSEIAKPRDKESDIYRLVRFWILNSEQYGYLAGHSYKVARMRSPGPVFSTDQLPEYILVDPGESFMFSWNSTGKFSCLMVSPAHSGISVAGSSSPIRPDHPFYPKQGHPTVFKMECYDGKTTETDSVIVSLTSDRPRSMRISARPSEERPIEKIVNLEQLLSSDKSSQSALMVLDAIKRISPSFSTEHERIRAGILSFDARMILKDKSLACESIRAIASIGIYSGYRQFIDPRLAMCEKK